MDTYASSLPVKKRKRSLNEEPDDALVATETEKVATETEKVATETEKVASSGNARYMGVVRQPNGQWEAQIHEMIWLGTFKSAAEAAAAYDSASIKIRGNDANSHRNFPLNDLTVREPEFQEGYSREAVLNMIRDGSYQHEYREFLRNHYQMAARNNTVGSKQSRGDEESNKCKQLFQTKLTASDVGKLNRLVIPSKYAVEHLPFVDQNEIEEGEIVEDVEVEFYDKAMKKWKFTYCYWRSSQSFVFTRGWNGFVKEKNLKENDVIVFSTCDVPSNVKTLEDQSKNFLMIDVEYSSDNGFVDSKGANKTVDDSSDEERKTENVPSSKLEDEDTKPEEKKGGFKLFGVRIQ